MKSCCAKSVDKTQRKCRRKKDGKIFDLPRKFSQRKCKGRKKGFTMRSSCAPYKGCNRSTRKNTSSTNKK